MMDKFNRLYLKIISEAAGETTVTIDFDLSLNSSTNEHEKNYVEFLGLDTSEDYDFSLKIKAKLLAGSGSTREDPGSDSELLSFDILNGTYNGNDVKNQIDLTKDQIETLQEYISEYKKDELLEQCCQAADAED